MKIISGDSLLFHIRNESYHTINTMFIYERIFVIVRRVSSCKPILGIQIIAESTNKVIKIALTKMVNDKRTDWNTKLHAAFWAHKTSYKVITKYTSFSLVFCTEALLPWTSP